MGAAGRASDTMPGAQATSHQVASPARTCWSLLWICSRWSWPAGPWGPPWTGSRTSLCRLQPPCQSGRQGKAGQQSTPSVRHVGGCTAIMHLLTSPSLPRCAVRLHPASPASRAHSHQGCLRTVQQEWGCCDGPPHLVRPAGSSHSIRYGIDLLDDALDLHTVNQAGWPWRLPAACWQSTCAVQLTPPHSCHGCLLPGLLAMDTRTPPLQCRPCIAHEHGSSLHMLAPAAAAPR
jgi:hypothetical protein